ncbi:MAG: hypothetical protein QOF51_1018 [Chloroflexota bacterium]|nr:hypothetical protein [Chloroflexota bacterium]
MRAHPPRPIDGNLLTAGFAIAGARIHLADPAAFATVRAVLPEATSAFERWLAAEDPAARVAPDTILDLPRLRGVPDDWRDLVIDSVRAWQNVVHTSAGVPDLEAAEAQGLQPVRLMRTWLSAVESGLCEVLRALQAAESRLP